MDKQHENPLGVEPINHLMARFAIPSIIAMLVSALYNMVDQFFIGHSVGMQGNAATNVAFPLTITCTAVSLLFGIGGAGASALLLGVTGGYPLGADAVARLRRSGALTREQAERALAFCNNSGPAFLVGAAGVGVFHSAGYGLLLYGVHVLSAVLVGMLFASRSGGSLPEPRGQIAAVSLAQALPEAVRSAVCAVLTVSGFVVTFSVVTGMLDASGLLPALVGTLSARLGLELHFARALCTGVLELGTGIGAMQGLTPTPANLALAAFLIGWGGVSVHCQTAAVLAGTDIKSARHTAGRLLHGVISALCMWVLANLF